MRKRGLKSRVRVWFLRRSTRRIFRLVIRIVLAGSIITVVTVIALHLPFSSIRSVSIAPESDVDQTIQADILTYAKNILSDQEYGVPGKTRYFFNKQKFEDLLQEAFLQADAITVESDFLNKWRIIAKKRESFGTHCTNAQCLVIDTKGVVFMETDITVGSTIVVADSLRLGEQVFGSDESAVTDFQKIPEIVRYLESGGFLVKTVSLRRDTRVVHINLENGIGIWLDSSEALYDTTRALHIIFEEVFSNPEKRAKIVSVDVRNPLSMLYEQK